MLAQSRELDLAKGRLQKSETDLDEQLALNQTKLVENQAISNELRKTGSDIATLHQEVSRATKLKDAQLKKLKVIERDGRKHRWSLMATAVADGRKFGAHDGHASPHLKCRTVIRPSLSVSPRYSCAVAHMCTPNSRSAPTPNSRCAGDRLREAGAEARSGDDPWPGILRGTSICSCLGRLPCVPLSAWCARALSMPFSSNRRLCHSTVKSTSRRRRRWRQPRPRATSEQSSTTSNRHSTRLQIRRSDR